MRKLRLETYCHYGYWLEEIRTFVRNNPEATFRVSDNSKQLQIGEEGEFRIWRVKIVAFKQSYMAKDIKLRSLMISTDTNEEYIKYLIEGSNEKQ